MQFDKPQALHVATALQSHAEQVTNDGNPWPHNFWLLWVHFGTREVVHAEYDCQYAYCDRHAVHNVPILCEDGHIR